MVANQMQIRYSDRPGNAIQIQIQIRRQGIGKEINKNTTGEKIELSGFSSSAVYRVVAGSGVEGFCDVTRHEM